MSTASQIFPPTALIAPPLLPAIVNGSWYAIHTRPKHEKKVVEELESKGIMTYLPTVPEVHRWSDRRKIMVAPLFSCYAFIRAVLDPHTRVSVLRVWGVLGFVGRVNQPEEIPDAQIEQVRRLLNSKVPFTSYPFLQLGQRVRVRGGALDGIEGVLVTQNERRLVISVQGMNRSLSIVVNGYDLEPA